MGHEHAVAAAAATTPSAFDQWMQDLVSGDLLARQLTTVQTLHIGFREGFTENPAATLIVLGTLLFVLSMIVRYLIYFAVRVSGRAQYDLRSRALENVWIILAFSLGIVAGDVCFQNLWLAAVTGGVFALISIGAVLEAVVANDAGRRARLRSGSSL